MQVVYDVPARLPALLASGEAQAILVSSIEALRAPCRVADGIAIASRGDVQSVRLFSAKPFDQVTSIALDTSSMTSNALAQIALSGTRSAGFSPHQDRGLQPATPLKTIHHAPDLEAMLKMADACVLIGDNGMRAKADGLQVMDLGRMWTETTGLPFVWAVWVGQDGLTEELSHLLRHSSKWGREHLEAIIPSAAAETGFSLSETRTYLAEIMDYDLGPDHKAGLAEFGRRLVDLGLLENAETPEWIGSTVSAG